MALKSNNSKYNSVKLKTSEHLMRNLESMEIKRQKGKHYKHNNMTFPRFQKVKKENMLDEINTVYR